jgi:hypothetical protein
MTGRKHRPPVSDRARRRAIRAHAAQLGVPYALAARLLAAQTAASPSASDELRWNPDEHRAWLFALRERRSFDMRVRDTRLAIELPLGRAAHLVQRFPALRRPPAGPLYDGESRQATLGMLYAVLAYESPAVLPTAEELVWAAELGEEAAVDIVCAGLDRAARLLLDDDRWRLYTRIEAALDASEAAHDRQVRDAAITLGQQFRTTILRGSLEGARHTLDALLVAAHDGHAPGTRVHILTGPHHGRAATVTGIQWQPTGAPRGYRIRIDEGPAAVTVNADDIGVLDRPSQPEPALP